MQKILAESDFGEFESEHDDCENIFTIFEDNETRDSGVTSAHPGSREDLSDDNGLLPVFRIFSKMNQMLEKLYSI
jgi:hypothetical protein